MNIRMVFKVLGRLLIFVGALMILPILVGIYYNEGSSTLLSFSITSILVMILGFLLDTLNVKIRMFYAKEGMVIVSLSWILMSFFGGLPLYFSGEYNSLIDAFFEMASGFTTTGATVSTNVEVLSNSVLFWRSFSHLLGGMGILVFVLAIMPKMNEDSIYLMKAEVPGPVFGKIVSKLGETARILYLIYLSLTLVLIFTLIIAGMPVFDSFLHAFGTAGTGGFGIKNSSIGYYNSSTIEIIIGVGMLIFGVNFNLYYLILIGKVKEFFKSEELRLYLSIALVSIILITFNVYTTVSGSWQNILKHSFFTVSSIMTTTGYSTVDFNNWPLFSHIILISLMFIGGSAGSTAGGIKVSRVGIGFKAGMSEIKRVKNPNRILTFKFEGKVIDKYFQRSLANYIILYVMVFVGILLIVSLDSVDFTTAFSSVAATFNNIGPGLAKVGPTGSFAGFSNLSKLALTFGMIAGRLEILPMLVLFSVKTWTKN